MPAGDAGVSRCFDSPPPPHHRNCNSSHIPFRERVQAKCVYGVVQLTQNRAQAFKTLQNVLGLIKK